MSSKISSSTSHPEDPTVIGTVWRLVYAAITFVIGCIFIITWMPTSLLFRIYRTIGVGMVRKKLGDQVMMASGGDAVWLQDSPTNKAIINTLLKFKGTPKAIEEYQTYVFDKMINKKDPDNPTQLLFPKMQRYTSKVLHRYVWLKEEEFAMNDHIFVHKTCAPDDKSGLQRVISEIAAEPFMSKRSPWQLIVIPPHNNNSESFHVLFRVHHSVGDGISLVKAFVQCLTDKPPEESKIVRFGAQNMWLRVIKAIFEGPGLVLARLFKPQDHSILHGPELTGQKIVAWSENIDLALIKKMKTATGTTVNDVLTSCLAGAFRQYFEKNSTEMPKEICSYVPVDMRQSKKLEMDNQFGLIFFDLPLDEDDPKELLRRTKKRMDLVKASPEPLVNNLLILYCMARLPNWITELALNWFSTKNTMIFTNVPGPAERMSVMGHDVEELIFWPPQRTNVALGVSILSYSGVVKIGVLSDSAVLTDPSILVDLYVENIKRLAGQLKVE